MDEKTSQGLAQIILVNFQMLFGLLHRKGLVDIPDILDEINAVRDAYPAGQMPASIAWHLNILEATFNPSGYQSPLPKPGDPDHPTSPRKPGKS